MKDYMSADYHFSHSNIIKYAKRHIFLTDKDKEAYAQAGNDWNSKFGRDYRISWEATNAMNDAIVKNTNDVVGEDDRLWFLGDWSFGGRKNYYNVARELRDRIKCRTVNLIYGNHDPRDIGDLFSNVYTLHEVNINGTLFSLCHYAMLTFNKIRYKSVHCYGHSHGSLEEYADKIMPGRRSLDVGIDNAVKLLGSYRPFSVDDIMKIMEKRSGFAADHHS